MGPDNKRSIKNFLIDKHFQFKFLIKFFIFSFILLTVGSTIQYHFANKTTKLQLSHINLDMKLRQRNMLVFLNNHKYLFDKDLEKIPASLRPSMKKTVDSYNNFISEEIKFIEDQLKETGKIVDENQKDSSTAFWRSILVVGIIMNTFFSFLYGIFLSHNFAGNHYRLQLFAKQLQDRDLLRPLTVRKRDFFQETANELDTARIIIQQDLLTMKKTNDTSVLEKYKLEKKK